MTDEELLERVAEIEGKERFTPWKDVDIDSRTIYEGVLEWNPLTNDAQAMELVNKYRMEVRWAFDRNKWRAVIDQPRGMFVGRDDSINRAVMMALVAAHEK